MLREKVQHQELENYLREPINRHGWKQFPTPEENAESKAALKETLRRAKEMLPRTGRYFIGRSDLPLHDCNRNYLMKMFEVKCGMEQGRWDVACNELVNVLHFYCIEDERILNAIIGMLEEYLCDGEEKRSQAHQTVGGHP